MNRPQLIALFLAFATLCGGAILFWPDASRPVPTDVEPGAEADVDLQPPEASPAPVPPAAPIAETNSKDPASQRTEQPKPETLANGSTVRIQVVDQDGNAMADVMAQALEAWDDRQYRASMAPQERLVYDPDAELANGLSDADGMIRLGGLPTHDELSLFLSKDGFAGVEIDLETGDSTEPVELGPVPLLPGVIVEVQVIDSSGQAVEGEVFQIGVSLPDEERENEGTPYPPINSQTAKTNAEGLARFPNLPIEILESIWFSGLNLGPESEIKELEESTDTHKKIRITIPALEWVEGRVIDTNGVPVEGAQITVRRGESWALEREEGLTIEDIVGENAGVFWHSHSSMDDFESEHVSDADGKFRADLSPKDLFGPDETGMSDLVAATALIGPDLAVAGTWSRKEDLLEVIVPVMHEVRGRVVHANGNPVPDCEVVFYPREEPQTAGDSESQPEYDSSRMHRPRGVPCDDSGFYQRTLEEGRYWAAVLIPGGRHRFAGPFDVLGPTEMEDLVLQAGPEFSIELVAEDAGLKLGDLRARRVEQPEEEEEEADVSSLFGGGRSNEPNTPWGARDFYWGESRYTEGEVDGNLVTWRNQPEGKWRYTVQVDGFLPVLVDRTITSESTVERVAADLVPLGQAAIRVLQRTGEPADGVTIQLFPVEGEGKNPIHEQLDDTPGMFHREGRAAVPDAEGIASFANVIPDTYEIYSIEGEDDDDHAWKSSIETPPLGRIVIASGERTEQEVTLAALAEVRVTVVSDGELVNGAQVFAQPIQDRGWARAFGPSGFGDEQERFTDATGAHLIPALIPGQAYRIGARMPVTGNRWQNKTAWTVVEMTPTVGTTELAIELASASIQFTLAGNADLGSCEITALNMDPLPALGEDADPDVQETRARLLAAERTAPWQSLAYRRSRAETAASVGDRVEFKNLTPGSYRVYVRQGENFRETFAELITEEFVLGDESLDLGTLTVEAWTPVRFELDCAHLPTENRWSYDLSCRRVQEDREVSELSLGFAREPIVEIKSYLPPGEYELVFSKDQTEVARSAPFQVVAGQEANVNWTLPEAPQDDD